MAESPEQLAALELQAGPEADALVALEIFNDPRPTEITEQQMSEMADDVVRSPSGHWLLMDSNPADIDAPYEWQPLAFSAQDGRAWWSVAEKMMVEADGYAWMGPLYTPPIGDKPAHWYVRIVATGVFKGIHGPTPALAVVRAALWLKRLLAERGG